MMWHENLLRCGKKCGEWILLFYVTVDLAIASNIEKVTGIKEGNVGLLKTEHSENTKNIMKNSSGFILTLCMIVGFVLFWWGLFQLRKEEKTKGIVFMMVGAGMAIISLIFVAVAVFEQSLLTK